MLAACSALACFIYLFIYFDIAGWIKGNQRLMWDISEIYTRGIYTRYPVNSVAWEFDVVLNPRQ